MRASADRGHGWSDAGMIEPAAFEAAGEDLYVARHDGTVKSSAESGKSWSVRSTP